MSRRKADTQPSDDRQPQECNCLALRQAARRATQFYDQFLAQAGLRTTQFSILARLKRKGPMTINALAADLVMDRSTLGRNILPLQRDGLLSIEPGTTDRRRKELHVTREGTARLTAATAKWHEAQSQFENVFGHERAAELRTLLGTISTSDLGADPDATDDDA